MSTYTADNGKTYDIQAGYKTGNLLVLGGGGCAWRVKKTALAAASPIFQDMFSASSSGGNELVISDTKRDTIQLFPDILHDKTSTLPSSWSEATRPAIDLLLKFDCSTKAKRLLHQSAENVHAQWLFEAFAAASQLDDLLTGCRILTQGHRWHAGEYVSESKSLSPDYDQNNVWTVKEANRLQPSWAWALTLASARSGDVNSAEVNLKEPKYWRGLVGEFMSKLAK